MLSQRDLFDDSEVICGITKDPENSGLEAMYDNTYVRYCQKHCALIKELSDIGLPKKNQQIRLVTRRSFNSVQFIEYIAEREKIDDMKMAVYSINYNAALILIDMINKGKIKKIEILMSNLRNKAHREKEEIIKKMLMKHPQISLFFCQSHAKTFSCKTEQGNYYTMEGSGNMAYNSRVEQYVIDNDKELYKFTKQWMQEIKEFLAGTKELEVC